MKKNILFISRNMGIGGTEKVILDLCYEFKDYFNNIIVCSAGGENVSNLEKLGIKHILIPDISKINYIQLLKTRRKIKEIVKEYDINIIHTHHRMAAFLCYRMKNIYLINNLHNTFYDKKMFSKLILERYLNIAVGKVVFDNAIKDIGISSRKVRLIENSINTKFNFEKINLFEENNKNKIKNFVFVGRLEEQKGLDILIDSFIDYFSNYNNVSLYIYGDGSQKNELMNKCINIKNISFMGYTNNPLNVISQCDLLILPSRWEGLPLNILEAIALGKPVLCSNIPSNIEIIEDGFNGFVFENESVASLIQKIDEFLNYKDMEIIKKNAVATFNSRYNYRNYINKYLAVYEEMRK